MIEGICPKCGLKQFGCGLLNPLYQICPDCNVPLDIYEEGNLLIGIYPAFEKDLFENPTIIKPVQNHGEVGNISPGSSSLFPG